MSLIYSLNKNNDDYIVLEDDIINLRILAAQRNFPNDLCDEILNIHLSMINSKLDSFHKIAIKKDSRLGRYLIQNSDEKKPDYISCKKVQGALLISLYKGDEKVSNKIWHMFKDDIEGFKEDLAPTTKEYVLDYILKNPSYDEYKKTLGFEEKKVEKHIVDEVDYISHEKVQGALLISLYTENDKISNRIWNLLKKDIEGPREILIATNDENVLDYILENPNYDEYRRKQDSNESEEEYIIYEDHSCRKSSLPKMNKAKVFVKKDV